MTDEEAERLYPQDAWVHDRLELARRMGYECGDFLTPTPKSGAYFVKPIRNPAGMGVRARVEVLDCAGFPGIEEDEFWMPRFIGRHVSVDYYQDGARPLVALCVPGVLTHRPAMWIRLPAASAPPCPAPLRQVSAPALNVEFIGGQVIEAHLRPNPDFAPCPDAVMAIPMWADMPLAAGEVPAFDDADGKLPVPRRGFVYVRPA